MKLNYNLKYLIFVLTLIFVSCDSPQSLVIQKNNTSSSISIFGNHTIFPKDNLNKFEYEKVIKIDSTLKSSQTYNYGLGNWSKEELYEISKKIDSIVIIQNNSKNIIINKKEIHSYLLARRKGLHNSKLILEN